MAGQGAGRRFREEGEIWIVQKGLSCRAWGCQSRGRGIQGDCGKFRLAPAGSAGTMLSGSPGLDKQPSNLPSPRPFFSSTDKLEFLLYSKSGMAFVLRNTAIWWSLFATPTCGLTFFVVTKTRCAHSVFTDFTDLLFIGSLCARYCAQCWDSAVNRDPDSVELTRCE